MKTRDVCASMFELGTRVTLVIMTQRVVDVDGWTAIAFNGICGVAFAVVKLSEFVQQW